MPQTGPRVRLRGTILQRRGGFWGKCFAGFERDRKEISSHGSTIDEAKTALIAAVANHYDRLDPTRVEIDWVEPSSLGF